MSGEKFVEVYAAGLPQRRELVSNIVRQIVRLVIDVLLRNRQDLAEIALDGSFDSPVALNVVQVPCAQNHKSGGGQNYGELQRQYQSSSLVPVALQLHSDATKHSLAAQGMCQWGVKRCKRL